jgi:hypothetical protein
VTVFSSRKLRKEEKQYNSYVMSSCMPTKQQHQSDLYAASHGHCRVSANRLLDARRTENTWPIALPSAITSFHLIDNSSNKQQNGSSERKGRSSFILFHVNNGSFDTTDEKSHGEPSVSPVERCRSLLSRSSVPQHRPHRTIATIITPISSFL